MKLALAAAAAALLASTSAHALVADGVTYTLTENSISANGLTANFTLSITGENTAGDTEGGRTGINAIAFNQPAPGTVTGGTMSAPSGFSFTLGGLNSSGCDGDGDFYCFDNSAIPPTPTTLLSGPLSFTFSVTADTVACGPGTRPTSRSTGLAEEQLRPRLVADHGRPWGDCVGCTPTPTSTVPEPTSLVLLGSALMTGGLALRRRRQLVTRIVITDDDEIRATVYPQSGPEPLAVVELTVERAAVLIGELAAAIVHHLAENRRRG